MVDSLCPAVVSMLEKIHLDTTRIKARGTEMQQGGGADGEVTSANMRSSLRENVMKSAGLVESLKTWESIQREGLASAERLDEAIQATAREAMILLGTLRDANPPEQVDSRSLLWLIARLAPSRLQ